MDDLLKLNGKNILGYKYSALSKELMEIMNPGTLERLDGQFAVATTEELDQAMELGSVRLFKPTNTAAVSNELIF